MFSASKSAAPSGAYTLSNSLRFRSSASAYLSRTATTPTNNLKWTWSGWVKRGALGTLQGIFDGYSNSSNWTTLFFNSDNTLYFYNVVSGIDWDFTTTAVFRDPSAWYHIVLVYDSANATAANRVIIYVNNVSQSGSSPSGQTPQNQTTFINAANAQALGRRTDGSYYDDGYMTEINFIDGQALTPSSFGSTDATTGVWQPARYSGSYGTNGFYLNFSNIALTSGSNTGLGKDYSGNGNYWNTNNISVTSGTTYDAMTDVPTNTSATVANYAVLDPLDPTTSGNATLSNANLTLTTSAANRSRLSSIGITSGKWYAEVIFSTSSGSLSGCMVGICQSSDVGSVVGSYLGSTANSYGYNQGGNKYNNASNSSYGASYTNNDVIGIAFDADNGTVTFYKNNTSQGTAYSSLSTSATWFIGVSGGISSASANITIDVNFGQRPFSYTPPTGYVALNTYNLPTPTILQGNKYMDATLWTGTSSNQNIVNAGQFKPDFAWIKIRNTTGFYVLVDSVRVGTGGLSILASNSTDAEATTNLSSYVTGFNSNGVALGNQAATSYFTNTSGNTFVGWQWQAGQGTTSSNTSGSITSTVSVNATAGFSVVTWTSDGFAGVKTMGHGLGVAPKFIIAKDRTTTSLWWVYHTSLASDNKYLQLQSTAAVTDASPTQIWSTSSTTFGIRQSALANNGDACVAYCWAEISGFSKFGSYTGNGSTDGPFVYLGFRPKFVMTKRTDSISNWSIHDSSRATYNLTINELYPDTSDAEYTGTNDSFDFLSNGFKARAAGTPTNTSGGTYIYAAFAESPFRNSLAR